MFYYFDDLVPINSATTSRPRASIHFWSESMFVGIDTATVPRKCAVIQSQPEFYNIVICHAIIFGSLS